MAKEDFIQAIGIVNEALPNAMFRVDVSDQPEPILCHLSGKMRKNFIKVLPGDRVLFEMSPYDLNKGRIIRRLRPGEEPLEAKSHSETTPQRALEPESPDQDGVASTDNSPSVDE